jgi:histidine triad (HIT) family protein
MSDCIFCRIVAGTIPANKIYEDDYVLAFHDISPAAPTHFLVVPKEHIPSLADCVPANAGVLARVMLAVPKVARDLGLHNGYRTIVNTGEGGGQTVFHLHAHVLGGGVPRPLGDALPATN